ncbi:hypothetical protein KNP414_07475 [Paenibacillus mucilaginosus KNP414]|uniref:General stress protein 17M-like domain-containing protein n=1 Tax=Paenibacillus mucilaginosus (strain KNP414) TaxID=1036673 RepID=F8F7G9_PAEMK|nr:hypothetical protein KNP414_07475 [Paenibacillus mucilaginosus KNP414]
MNAMDKRPRISVVHDANEARDQVRLWVLQGHNKEEIYVLAHDDARTDLVADYSDAEKIGMSEEGVWNSIANMFRSQGDELRAKLKALHVPDAEAERLEQELDDGKIVLLATGGR